MAGTTNSSGDGSQNKNETQPEGPINFINSYFESQEFKKRYLLRNSYSDYEDQMRKYREKSKGYKPYIKNDTGSGAVNEDNNKQLGYPKGTTIVLDPNQAKKIGDNLFNGVLPHEYTHSISNLTNKDQFKINDISKDKEILKKVINLYKTDKDKSATLSNWINTKLDSGNLLHDYEPEEQHADLNTLRWLMYKEGIYDTRNGNMNQDDIKKALENSVISNSFEVRRLLDHFSPQKLIELNNTVAYNDYNKGSPNSEGHGPPDIGLPAGYENEDNENPPLKKPILTPKNKRDWNDFLDHLQKIGIGGSKDLDQPDKNDIKGHIQDYKKENPNSTVSEDMVPLVQSEQQQLRNGDSYAGLSPEHTKVLRQQLNGDYMKRPIAKEGGPFDSTLSRQYFPEFKKGDKNYGTDAQAYMKDFLARPASDSTAKINEPVKEEKAKEKEDIIPYPDYNDQKSRNKYLEEWQKKYGPLDSQGDTVLKVNEVPRGASDTIKNISVKTAKEYGLDPALLYASMMREGGAGLFKNKDGTDTRHRKPGEYGYQGFYGDKEFPINGNESFGVPDFAKRFPDLVAGGYLPKEFASRFRGTKNAGEYSENDFKTVEDGMKAKAALMKQSYDEVDKYAKQEGITLSKNAKDFFALADFNSGANFKKILKRYNEEGLLKDDKFLKEHPHKNEVIDQKDDVWAHVAPRLRMASALKQQKHFENED